MGGEGEGEGRGKGRGEKKGKKKRKVILKNNKRNKLYIQKKTKKKQNKLYII